MDFIFHLVCALTTAYFLYLLFKHPNDKKGILTISIVVSFVLVYSFSGLLIHIISRNYWFKVPSQVAYIALFLMLAYEFYRAKEIKQD
jgi:multisubunit Na+/H+ antiporter MnhE subunit